MPRNRIPPPPGPGRPKGSKNKKTQFEAILKAAIGRPEYLERLFQRVERGKATHMELFFWHHLHGKPKDTTELTGAEGGPLVVSWKKHRA